MQQPWTDRLARTFTPMFKTTEFPEPLILFYLELPCETRNNVHTFRQELILYAIANLGIIAFDPMHNMAMVRLLLSELFYWYLCADYESFYLMYRGKKLIECPCILLES